MALVVFAIQRPWQGACLVLNHSVDTVVTSLPLQGQKVPQAGPARRRACQAAKAGAVPDTFHPSQVRCPAFDFALTSTTPFPV